MLQTIPQTSFAPPPQAFLGDTGMLRTGQALAAGLHPSELYAMRDAGVLEELSRGVFRLADAPPLEHPDLVTVALRVPQGVICLISALSFHELTTQIPHEIHIALPRGAEQPRLDYPSIKAYRFSPAAFEKGVEHYTLDGIEVAITSTEKTLADVFKFRNQLGLDTALEALRLYRDRGAVNMDELMACAQACRMKNVMRPYLEAILG